jgi:hypothetical protein
MFEFSGFSEINEINDSGDNAISKESIDKFDKLMGDDKIESLEHDEYASEVPELNEINDLGDNTVSRESMDKFDELMGDDLNDDAKEQENPHTEIVDGKTNYYDDNGKLYRVEKDLVPNTTYEINGYKYTTDDKGRIISAEGTLHMKEREGRLQIKDSIEDIGKGDQKEGDDRGHLIGDQFDGSNGLENMIPQDADINEKDFRYFENDLAKEVKDGKEVTVKVEPIYEGESRRPDVIVVTYSIDGEESVRIFPNNKEG